MRELKRCARCATVKSPSELSRNKGRADGLQPYCRVCRAEIDHERYERELGRTVARRSRTSYAVHRGAWLRSLKAGRPCTDCGRTFEPQVMQWDHLPEFQKVGDIGGGPWLAGRTPEEILVEVAKCELVCTNCHAVRTFRRGGWANRSLRNRTTSRRIMQPDAEPVASAPDVAVRTCAMCSQTKPGRGFHRSRTGQFSYCRDCRCAYDRRYYAERGKRARLERQRMRRDVARNWMDSLKDGQPCADCGAIFAPFIMHWDHLPGHLKVDEIGSMISSARRARILEEVAKCELVCANCHVMRTVRRARRTISEEAREYRTEGTSAA